MSIKAQLLAVVARCTPQQTQHATFADDDATRSATGAQHGAGFPRDTSINPATDGATDAQRWAKGGATSAPGCVLRSLGDATRNFDPLTEAAMRACDAWGDGPEARAAMRRDCLATPEHLRADLLAHFRTAYGGQLAEPSARPAAGKHPRGP